MTIISPNGLNTTLFQDGQAPGSITPASERTLINSLAGRFGNPQTSSYTFAAVDFGTIIPITNAGNQTATVPLNTTVAFDQWTILGVMQGGNGAVTWTPAAGVTIIAPPSKMLVTNGPGAISFIWQTSINTWQAFDGGLLPSMPVIPPQAIAAGYAAPALIDNFSANSINYNGTYTPTAGSPTFPNWYTANQETTPLTSAQAFVSNGQLTITTCNSFAMGLVTCPNNFSNTAANNSVPGSIVGNNTNGQTFTYGYFEASIQYAQNGFTSGGGWPSFWLTSTMTNNTNNYPHIELDIIEAQPTGGSGSAAFLGSTLHGYFNNSTTFTNGVSTAITTPAGFDWTKFHTYGMLWSPSGVFFYIDNVLSVMPSGTNPVNAASTPALSVFNPEVTSTLAAGVNGCNLILGTGINWPMVVDYVHVWQA